MEGAPPEKIGSDIATPREPEAMSSAWLMEGFAAWEPSSETPENCLWRLQRHVVDAVRDSEYAPGLLSAKPGEDLSWADWNSFGRYGLLGTVSTEVAPGAASPREKEEAGKAIRGAFDAVVGDFLSREAVADELPPATQEAAARRAAALLYVEELGYGTPSTAEEGFAYFEGVSTNGRSFFNKPDDYGYRRRVEADATSAALASGLFQLPFLTELGARYVGGLVNGRRLAFIGGGKSAQDFLDDPRFTPEKVVNVDPFVSRESVRRGARGNYRSCSLDALSPSFAQDLAAEGEGAFDEIWCTHSLPHYVDRPEDFETFFENMLSTLRVGGTCRIFPLVIYGMADRTEEEDQARLDALRAAIARLADDPRCSIAVSGGVFDPSKEAYGKTEGAHALLTVRRVR